jgi:hypothetical protein
MNQVMFCQATLIDQYLSANKQLEAREFMSDMHMPFDQQDRVFNAIGRLSRPNARKIGLIIELSGINPTNELLLR